MQTFQSGKLRLLILVSLTGLSLSLISIFFLDQRIAYFFSNPDFAAFRIHARDITNIGEAVYWFALSIFVFTVSIVALKKPQIRQRLHLSQESAKNGLNWSLHFLACLSVSGILLQLMKFIVGRQRPHLSETFDPLVFSPFNWHWHWQSFPSGHTQTLTCAAINMSLAFPRYRKIIFLLCVLLALTRVVILQHFLGDVIAGATVGWLGTVLSLLWFQRKLPIAEPIF